MSYEVAYQFIFAYMLVFCRMGTLMTFVPLVSEIAISYRIKLFFALMLSLIVCTIQADNIPVIPKSFAQFLLYIFSEMLIGIALGSLIKILMSALHIVGLVFGYQSGMASGSIFDPTQGSQGSIFGNFLSLCFLMLVLATNLHIAIIEACIKTYEAFPIGSFFTSYESFVNSVIRVSADAYKIGIKIAMPFLALGLLFNLSAGVSFENDASNPDIFYNIARTNWITYERVYGSNWFIFALVFRVLRAIFGENFRINYAKYSEKTCTYDTYDAAIFSHQTGVSRRSIII